MKRSTSYSQANDKVTEMNTLTACLAKAVRDGYTENFKVVDDRLAASDDKTFGPEDIHIINFYRFEGESDPGDMAILYVIRTEDGHMGTLLDAYGPYADDGISVFIQQVEDIRKHVEKRDHTKDMPDAPPQV